MVDILEVKMERIGDDLKIIVPESFCKQLGLEHGDTLLVTVEEERVVMKKNTGRRVNSSQQLPHR